MARERILVKDAMMRVKRVLRELLKLFQKNNGDNDSYGDLSDINLLALSIKFLAETKKIDDILFSISKVICDMQITDIDLNKTILLWDDNSLKFNGKELSGAWVQPSFLLDDGELDIEDFYNLVIYPTSRSIEALSYISEIDPEVILKGLNFLDNSIKKIDLENLCDDLNKCVPIVQGVVKGLSVIDEEHHSRFMSMLKSIKDYVTEMDPELDSIYAQDIYYTIRAMETTALSESELAPLYNDIESKIFRKLLKGIEYLSIFSLNPPVNINDKLLVLTSRYFNNLFRIKQTDKGFFYYSSLAESVYNILKHAGNRSFAETVMNLLTEDSGWIYHRKIDSLDVYRVIIGGGLLVLARAALRK
ncbi:MAG: hypothetical protein ACP6IP_05415 [Candidatus Njordarchaeia archaeon]